MHLAKKWQWGRTLANFSEDRWAARTTFWRDSEWWSYQPRGGSFYGARPIRARVLSPIAAGHHHDLAIIHKPIVGQGFGNLLFHSLLLQAALGLQAPPMLNGGAQFVERCMEIFYARAHVFVCDVLVGNVVNGSLQHSQLARTHFPFVVPFMFHNAPHVVAGLRANIADMAAR